MQTKRFDLYYTDRNSKAGYAYSCDALIRYLGKQYADELVITPWMGDVKEVYLAADYAADNACEPVAKIVRCVLGVTLAAT